MGALQSDTGPPGPRLCSRAPKSSIARNIHAAMGSISPSRACVGWLRRSDPFPVKKMSSSPRAPLGEDRVLGFPTPVGQSLARSAGCVCSAGVLVGGRAAVQGPSQLPCSSTSWRRCASAHANPWPLGLGAWQHGAGADHRMGPSALPAGRHRGLTAKRVSRSSLRASTTGH
jgi:hypothetical protein